MRLTLFKCAIFRSCPSFISWIVRMGKAQAREACEYISKIIRPWTLKKIEYPFGNVIEQCHRVGQRYLLSHPWIESIIYLVVGLIGFFCIYNLSLKGALYQLHELKTQTQWLHEQYRMSKVVIARQTHIVQLLSQKKLALSLHLQKLITHQSISHIFRNLQQLAQKSSLRIVYFSPQNRELKQFYTQIPLHVIVLGRYQNLVHFLGNILQNRYSITLHNFQLQLDTISAKSKQFGIDPLLKMDMFFHVYIK